MANKDKIVNLVGASGSGKTTIAKELEKLGYNIIHSFTTREPREENEWGHTFVKHAPVKSLGFKGDMQIKGIEIDRKNMIAFFSGYKKYKEGLSFAVHYWATKEQYKGKGTSIYIVDPDGAEQVKENVKDAEVVTIFLNADKENRISRIRNRLVEEYEDMVTARKEIKTIREKIRYRINKDKEIFKACKCDYTVDANGELEEVLKEVVEIIGDRNE